MRKARFFKCVSKLTTIPLVLSLVSISSLSAYPKIDRERRTLSVAELSYYIRLTSSQRRRFEWIAFKLNMGTTQRVNALRYRFLDHPITDTSVFGTVRFFAKFLADTIKSVNEDDIMKNVYDLSRFLGHGSKKGEVLTVEEVII